MITFTFNWAVGIAGRGHFVGLLSNSRRVLCRGGELGKEGETTNMNPGILDWLKGGKKTLDLSAGRFKQ
jgi:hypothetical protein